MPQLINCISSGLNIKRQTTTEKENPQIGSAVWRGIIENAFLSFIQILCQPSQPDLKGFSIKSWTWQVMAIYSTHKKVQSRLISSLTLNWTFQQDNEAILAQSLVYFYLYFKGENHVWGYCLLTNIKKPRQEVGGIISPFPPCCSGPSEPVIAPCTVLSPLAKTVLIQRREIWALTHVRPI